MKPSKNASPQFNLYHVFLTMVLPFAYFMNPEWTLLSVVLYGIGWCLAWEELITYEQAEKKD